MKKLLLSLIVLLCAGTAQAQLMLDMEITNYMVQLNDYMANTSPWSWDINPNPNSEYYQGYGDGSKCRAIEVQIYDTDPSPLRIHVTDQMFLWSIRMSADEIKPGGENYYEGFHAGVIQWSRQLVPYITESE